MLKNTHIQRQIIRRIAIALGGLNEHVLYVGGAVVCLYVNDPAADDVRPTKDIDISLALASLGELESARQQLIEKGFTQSADDDIICRFRYDDIQVDVMNTKTIGWAPANPWFAPGFERKEQVVIEDQRIYLLPLPYFLASKFVAFNDRGAREPRASHDFEDIIYILDNCTDIIEQLTSAPDDVKPWVVRQLSDILTDPVKQEAILSNLFYETRAQRYDRIINSIHAIVKSTTM